MKPFRAKARKTAADVSPNCKPRTTPPDHAATFAEAEYLKGIYLRCGAA
jgi:hypothetical protein